MIPVLRDMQADYVVFHVNCNDKRENGYWYQVKREESSMNDFDLLGEIADVWHNRFEDEGIYAQPICWVQDAVGSSAVLSLSFCDLYTSSEATIGGLQGAAQMFERVRNDENTYGKYREAFLGMFRGPLELGRIAVMARATTMLCLMRWCTRHATLCDLAGPVGEVGTQPQRFVHRG